MALTFTTFTPRQRRFRAFLHMASALFPTLSMLFFVVYLVELDNARSLR